MLNTIKLLGVTITNENPQKILEYIFSKREKDSEKVFVTTPNPEILVYANSHKAYRDKLNESMVALPDGVGLVIGSYLLGRPLQHRITGVDFMEMVCRESREPRFNRGEKPMSIGFLGGRSGVAEGTLDRLKKKYPWIDGYVIGEDWSASSLPKDKMLDILFVAYGFPKQEEWIYEHLPHLPVRAAMGVGGAFDYLSGRVKRAPRLVRKLGLEWLFRLVIQPWRWKRQLALIKFLYLVFCERIGRL